jgi:hypothetical protein
MVSQSSKKRTALVVLGMHRSGTSALARALSFFDYAQPSDLVRPQPDNPKGFWESRAIVRLNRNILDALGGTWSKPGPFLLEGKGPRESRNSLEEAIWNRFGDAAIAVLKNAYPSEGPIVLKDPRINLFLPLWQRALDQAGYAPKFILIYRNPLEVAASLRERNRLGLRQSLLLWEQYNLAAMELCRNNAPIAVMGFDEFLRNPQTTLDMALTRLDVPAPLLGEEAALELREFVAGADKHHIATPEDLTQTPRVANLIRDTWFLLQRWDKCSLAEQTVSVLEMRETFDNAIVLAGSPTIVTEAKLYALADQAEQRSRAAGSDGRTLVVHYHLFKNAGTSVDELLKRNFGGRWAQMEFEGGPGRERKSVQLTNYLLEKPNLLAFSSHTTQLPVPVLEGVSIFPIVFVRHPIDRLRSAYSFERVQNADTLGARIAKQNDFAGYLREHLQLPLNRSVRNFQTARLARNEPAAAGSELERALRTLKALPFIGLVEAYDRSIERLEVLLRPRFPRFQAVMVHRNATRPEDSSLEDRLAAVEHEIGTELFRTICAANADDLEVYSAIKACY